MWEPLNAGLGPQPLHLDIICSLAVTQEISQLSEFCCNKYGGSGMMVDQSAHPQPLLEPSKTGTYIKYPYRELHGSSTLGT